MMDLKQLKIVTLYDLVVSKDLNIRSDLLELDTIRSYDLKFNSPQNPEKYLEAVFGKNWKTPKQKQFIWKK